MTETCETCRFWDDVTTSNPGVFGYCRRNPPLAYGQVHAMNTYIEPTAGTWPVTAAIDWCGEFSRKVPNAT